LLLAVAIVLPGSTGSSALPLSQRPSTVPEAAQDVGLVEDVARRGRVSAPRRLHSAKTATGKPASKRAGSDVNVNRAANVNRQISAAAVRPWVRRPYYGVIVGGVVLGGVLTAATVGVSPVPPAAGLCWSWSDTTMVRGYWDYCP